MANKKFVGEVLRSDANDFAGSDGEMVETHKLEVLLTEDRGITFNISKQDGLYDIAQQIEPGQIVHVTAEPMIKNDGKVKYKAVAIEVVDRP